MSVESSTDSPVCPAAAGAPPLLAPPTELDELTDTLDGTTESEHAVVPRT
jgi:hypothetical protein